MEITAVAPAILYNGTSGSTRTIDGTINTHPVRITHSIATGYDIEQIGGTGALAVPAGSTFVPDATTAYRDAVLIICAGTNDRLANIYDGVTSIVAIANHNRPFFKRILVVSPRSAGSFGGNGATREAPGSAAYVSTVKMQRLLREIFGTDYVDMVGHLVNNGLGIAGLSPTAQDLTDIADGIIPESLRADSLHSNNYGHDAEAWLIQKILTSRSIV